MYGATIDVGAAKVVVVSVGASLDAESVREVSDVESLESPPQAVRDMRLMMAMTVRRIHEKYTSQGHHVRLG